MIKRIVITIIILFYAILNANAQTGTWSGKLDVQGTKLSLVFNLDGDKPTMDSPDQGVKGLAAQVERYSAAETQLYSSRTFSLLTFSVLHKK